MWIGATQISTPDCHAVPVEEVEDLDCNLAPVLYPVTELGGDEGMIRRARGELGDNADHFLHRRAQEEVIMHQLIDAAEPGQ